MLIVRFRETFRDRQMEWALTAGATAWGAIMVRSPDAFDRPFYDPLKRMAPGPVWGWSIFIVGLVGLVVLLINGAWRRTPFLRMVASACRNIVWSFLLMGCLSVEWQTPAAGVYAMMVFMEAMAISNAAADRVKVLAGVRPHGA